MSETSVFGNYQSFTTLFWRDDWMAWNCIFICVNEKPILMIFSKIRVFLERPICHPPLKKTSQTRKIKTDPD